MPMNGYLVNLWKINPEIAPMKYIYNTWWLLNGYFFFKGECYNAEKSHMNENKQIEPLSHNFFVVVNFIINFWRWS